MREAFGGGFMIKLMLVFIVVYTCFMAVAIQCAKTFRIKNNVINMIEQNQFKLTDDYAFIDNYLRSASYNMGSNSDVENKCSRSGSVVRTDEGVCIEQLGDSSNMYYRVTAYVSIAFPFFDIYLTLPIRGETKIIK